ncbi:hypothetical protein AB0J83_25540 [Actinoplanes sp. NPDC049596]|uniref:hypothetical protein n=1 Tax=unclassified Actinoplanes TaxID=2626549 RepID=UPI00341E859C
MDARHRRPAPDPADDHAAGDAWIEQWRTDLRRDMAALLSVFRRVTGFRPASTK